jgi:hypothetical protein
VTLADEIEHDWRFTLLRPFPKPHREERDPNAPPKSMMEQVFEDLSRKIAAELDEEILGSIPELPVYPSRFERLAA